VSGLTIIDDGPFERQASRGPCLRDWLAAQVSMGGVALSALEALEGPFPAYADAKAKQDWYARAEAAYRYHRADAMLKARQS
jgi:hypothetical protein